MRTLLLVLFGVGAALLAYNWTTSGEQPRLEGEITEVRTLAVEEEASVLLVNFQVENITNLPFVAHERWLEVVDAEGNQHQGRTVEGFHMKELFGYFSKELGGMKDAPMVFQTRIEAGDTHRALLGARFEMSKADLDARRAIIVRIVDGVRRETQIRQPAQD